jgi:hypothetical protein
MGPSRKAVAQFIEEVGSPILSRCWKSINAMHEGTLEFLSGSTSHMGFGSGAAAQTGKFLNEELPGLERVVGYDPIIQEEGSDKGVFMTSRLEGSYDSVSCNFVLHETEPKAAIAEIKEHLNNKGKVSIVDYDMQHLRSRNNGRSLFQKLFCTMQERSELRDPDSFEKHTAYGLEQCKSDLEEAGFEVMDCSKEMGKYFQILAVKK